MISAHELSYLVLMNYHIFRTWIIMIDATVTRPSAKAWVSLISRFDCTSSTMVLKREIAKATTQQHVLVTQTKAQCDAMTRNAIRQGNPVSNQGRSWSWAGRSWSWAGRATARASKALAGRQKIGEVQSSGKVGKVGKVGKAHKSSAGCKD